MLVWALGGNEPSREAHNYPLNLLNSYLKAPIEGEPDITVLKAWRPIFNESACMHPAPLPGLGAAAADSNIYTKVSVLLKGEQNINLPSVGSEQHATQSAPQIFIVPPLLDTCACSSMPGEGATSVRCVANCHR